MTAVMLLVFLLLGRLTLPVVLGALLGACFAVLNFFLLGLTVQGALRTGDESRSKMKMQLSYSCLLYTSRCV